MDNFRISFLGIVYLFYHIIRSMRADSFFTVESLGSKIVFRNEWLTIEQLKDSMNKMSTCKGTAT